MSKYVLDASAVLASLQDEDGKEFVGAILDEAIIGRVNVTEVLTTLVNKVSELSDAIAALDSLEIKTVEFDREQSELTAQLRTATRHLGLSLGDRACLALAIRSGAIAVTADRNWLDIDLCSVHSIR
jgi:PIN domain nuclease of toxin-antitoxin system